MKSETAIRRIDDLYSDLASAREVEARIEREHRAAGGDAKEACRALGAAHQAASEERARAILEQRPPSRDIERAVELGEKDVVAAERRVKDTQAALQLAREAVTAKESVIESSKLAALRKDVNGDVEAATRLRREYGRALAGLRDKAVRHGFPGGLPESIVFGARDPNDLGEYMRRESESYAMNAVLGLHDAEQAKEAGRVGA